MTERIPREGSLRCAKDHRRRFTEFSNRKLSPGRYPAMVYLSDLLRRISAHIPALDYVADSLYVSTVRLDGVPSIR